MKLLTIILLLSLPANPQAFSTRGKPCAQFISEAQPLAGRCESAWIQDGRVVTYPQRCTAIVYVDGRLRAWQYWEVKNAAVGDCYAVPRREVVKTIEERLGKGWVFELRREK